DAWDPPRRHQVRCSSLARASTGAVKASGHDGPPPCSRQWRIFMLRSSSCSRAIALALLFVAVSGAEALAHCFAGARFFPATLATEDPCVADELSLPTVQWSKTGDVPAATEWTFRSLRQTHHRRFRDYRRRYLVAHSPAGRLYAGRIRQS